MGGRSGGGGGTELVFLSSSVGGGRREHGKGVSGGGGGGRGLVLGGVGGIRGRGGGCKGGGRGVGGFNGERVQGMRWGGRVQWKRLGVKWRRSGEQVGGAVEEFAGGGGGGGVAGGGVKGGGGEGGASSSSTREFSAPYTSPNRGKCDAIAYARNNRPQHHFTRRSTNWERQGEAIEKSTLPHAKLCSPLGSSSGGRHTPLPSD